MYEIIKRSGYFLRAMRDALLNALAVVSTHSEVLEVPLLLCPTIPTDEVPGDSGLKAPTQQRPASRPPQRASSYG